MTQIAPEVFKTVSLSSSTSHGTPIILFRQFPFKEEILKMGLRRMQPVPAVHPGEPIHNPSGHQTQQHFIHPDESLHQEQESLPMPDPPPEILPQNIQHS